MRVVQMDLSSQLYLVYILVPVVEGRLGVKCTERGIHVVGKYLLDRRQDERTVIFLPHFFLEDFVCLVVVFDTRRNTNLFLEILAIPPVYITVLSVIPARRTGKTSWDFVRRSGDRYGVNN